MHRSGRRSLVAALTIDDARPHDPPDLPLVDAANETGATLVVLGRGAQSDDDVVVQAALLHERGIRVRTLSMFYEQWLGKLPVSELERVSLLFDIGEIHAPRYARLKRLLDVCAVARCALPVLARADRRSSRSATCSATAARCSSASPARVATAASSRS